MDIIDNNFNELFRQIKEDEYGIAIDTFEKILDTREQKFKREISILHKRIDKLQDKGVEKNTPLPKEDTIKIGYFAELRKSFVNRIN